jgi:hypothetical protein
MSTTLLETVRRYADAYVNADGVAQTPIPGLFMMRATMPSQLVFAISRPLVALVVQGGKRVTMGSDTFDFGGGDTLLIAADVPTVSQITRANMAVPYYSLVLELDLGVIEALSTEIDGVHAEQSAPVKVAHTEAEVADSALRLLRLIDRPGSLPLLLTQGLREMHYWLLAGRHGAAIRSTHPLSAVRSAASRPRCMPSSRKCSTVA